jgi:hypothetical protein
MRKMVLTNWAKVAAKLCQICGKVAAKLRPKPFFLCRGFAATNILPVCRTFAATQMGSLLHHCRIIFSHLIATLTHICRKF